MKVMMHLCWLPALLLLVACTAPADNEAPVQVVKDFVAAWEAGDTDQVLNLLEPADWREEIGPEVRAYTGRIQGLNFENPTYTLVDNNNSLAHVRLDGTLHYDLHENISDQRDVSVMVEVVKVDGDWYIRNVDLSQTFVEP